MSEREELHVLHSHESLFSTGPRTVQTSDWGLKFMTVGIIAACDFIGTAVDCSCTNIVT